jgi:predicted RNA binding protein YcfA (HicA-like mRNA interferase family)
VKRAVKDLIKKLEAAGAEVSRSKKSHWLIRYEGRIIATMSSTPSDPRSIKNVIAHCRRAGIDI